MMSSVTCTSSTRRLRIDTPARGASVLQQLPLQYSLYAPVCAPPAVLISSTLAGFTLGPPQLGVKFVCRIV